MKTATESGLLHVGECIVDLAHREIRTPNHGVPIHIKMKTLDVLLALVNYPGRAVSREALLEMVWPNTMPTNDVVTQAIAQLRKAFGDDYEHPKYVETIPKGGYRLVAPVAWIQGDPAFAIEATPRPRSTSPVSPGSTSPVSPASGKSLHPSFWAAGIVALFIAALGLFAWHRQRPTETTVLPAFQRITSLPGTEQYPSLSPDGSQVVYSAPSWDKTRADLIVQATAPVPGHELLRSPHDVRYTMPAWSPDGRQVALVALGPADRCSIQVVAPTGGLPRVVSGCRQGSRVAVGWSPDGSKLVTTLMGSGMRNDGAIHTIDLESGTWKRLNYEKRPDDLDLAPTYSPDGRWIAFHRNLSASDVWRVPAAGGQPEQLTHLGTNILSLAWTPDSQSIVFGRFVDGSVSTVLSRIDLRSRQVSDIGTSGSAFPSIGLRSASVAFSLDQSRSTLYKLHLGPDGDKTIEAVFSSSGNDLLPSIAPDGAQVAFVSDRSAGLGVWCADLGRPESLRMFEGIVPVPRYAPAWSDDSRHLLVIGHAATSVADSPAELFELSPGSGRAQRLPVPSGEPVHAQYMDNASEILVVVNQGAGRLRAVLYNRRVNPWKVVAFANDVKWIQRDPARRRILFTRSSKQGLWQFNLALGNERSVAPEMAIGAERLLIAAQDGVWITASRPDCGLALDSITRANDPGRCLASQRLNATATSLDDVHDDLFFSAEEEGSDIGLMHLGTGY